MALLYSAPRCEEMPSVVSQSVIVGVLLLLWLFMSSDASLSSCRGLVTIEIHPFYLMGERRRIRVSIISKHKSRRPGGQEEEEEEGAQATRTHKAYVCLLLLGL